MVLVCHGTEARMCFLAVCDQGKFLPASPLEKYRDLRSWGKHGLSRGNGNPTRKAAFWNSSPGSRAKPYGFFLERRGIPPAGFQWDCLMEDAPAHIRRAFRQTPITQSILLTWAPWGNIHHCGYVHSKITDPLPPFSRGVPERAVLGSQLRGVL